MFSQEPPVGVYIRMTRISKGAYTEHYEHKQPLHLRWWLTLSTTPGRKPNMLYSTQAHSLTHILHAMTHSMHTLLAWLEYLSLYWQHPCSQLVIAETGHRQRFLICFCPHCRRRSSDIWFSKAFYTTEYLQCVPTITKCQTDSLFYQQKTSWWKLR